MEGIWRRLKEQGDEEEQEINSINHSEEMLVRLNVAIETNEGTEAEIAIEVNETAQITSEEQLINDKIKELVAKGETSDKIMLHKVDRKKFSEETQQVNRAVKQLLIGYISQTNNLIKAASLWVNKQL